MDNIGTMISQLECVPWQLSFFAVMTLSLFLFVLYKLRETRQHKKLIEQTSAQNSFLRKAMDAVSHAVVITDEKGVIVDANPAYSNLTGYHRDEIIGKKPKELSSSGHQSDEFYDEMWQTLQSGQHWHGELVNISKTGECYYQEMKISGIKDDSDQVTHFIGVAHNITDRKRSEKQKLEQAQFDPLTGLPNRMLFFDRLDQTFHAAKREEAEFSLLFIDLDGFKPINDRHGHCVGDEVLKVLGSRLQDFLRGVDTVARYGGDEYVVILAPNTTPEKAMHVTGKILELIEQPIELELHNKPLILSLSASVGIANYPTDGINAEQLISLADKNMYHHKSSNQKQR